MGSVSIAGLAKSIVGRYDHNRNGVIDLRHPTKGDERTRRETQHSMNAIDHYTWDHEALFKASDANGDGQVSRAEIETTLKRFDKDGDGALKTRGWIWNPKAEFDFYDQALGEDLIDHTHIPLGPPMPPIPVPHPPHPRHPQTMLA